MRQRPEQMLDAMTDPTAKHVTLVKGAGNFDAAEPGSCDVLREGRLDLPGQQHGTALQPYKVYEL